MRWTPQAPLSFEDLGGDSLSALSLSMLLEEIYDLEVPVGVITHPSGSLQKLADYIEQARSAGSERPTFSSVHGKDATEVHATDLTLEQFIDAATLEEAAYPAARVTGVRRAPCSSRARTAISAGSCCWNGSSAWRRSEGK